MFCVDMTSLERGVDMTSFNYQQTNFNKVSSGNDIAKEG